MTNQINDAHKDPRKGRFKISQSFLEKEYPTILEMFKTLRFVWRVEHNYFQQSGIEYYACCEQFDEISDGDEIPMYQAKIYWENEYDMSLMKDLDKKIRIEWERI